MDRVKARVRFYYFTLLSVVALLMQITLHYVSTTSSSSWHQDAVEWLAPLTDFHLRSMTNHSNGGRTRETEQMSFHFDRERAENVLQARGAQAIRRVLSAYLEPPLRDTLPGSGSRGNLSNHKDPGTPPDFYVPLPLRTSTPSQLIRHAYPRVQTCHDLPSKFPIDRGRQLDHDGRPVRWNIGNGPTPDDLPQQEAPYCPVEADPYLPWIHDVFPSIDGSHIIFIAQNKRRCRTGQNHTKDVNRLVPQVALFQPISVERIDEARARRLAPELWFPDQERMGQPTTSVPRYRLAPRNESADDGMNTRFICRFHATDFSSNEPRSVLVSETLSEYPFNYEYVAYRNGVKNNPLMISPKGKDAFLIWTSSLRFHCPVPADAALRQRIASGELVLSDGTPTLYVDVIPIRTSTRWNETYLTEEEIGPQSQWPIPPFDPIRRWGSRNVLPRVEASGRWENIPICQPPRAPISKETAEKNHAKSSYTKKPHFLSACLWASAQYMTRGGVDGADTDVLDRLNEWMEFHLLAGFDHIYLYDNSRANSETASLKSVADRFPGQVTWIDWPSHVCNNNLAQEDSMGEWSSQYAAESSCRARYSPFTEWIGTFDTDEYLIPMGNYSSLVGVLQRAQKKGSKILKFRSSRGLLRFQATDSSLEKRPNVTFLEAYNCDSSGVPKPSWTDNNRKELYQADFVLHHFVHYTLATKVSLQTFGQTTDGKWRRRYDKLPDPAERTTDEEHEAVMVHARKVDINKTGAYKETCHKDFVRPKKNLDYCFVAFPWPNATFGYPYFDSNDMRYNCFENDKVDKYWVPKLRMALKRRRGTKTVERHGRLQ